MLFVKPWLSVKLPLLLVALVGWGFLLYWP